MAKRVLRYLVPGCATAMSFAAVNGLWKHQFCVRSLYSSSSLCTMTKLLEFVDASGEKLNALQIKCSKITNHLLFGRAVPEPEAPRRTK